MFYFKRFISLNDNFGNYGKYFLFPNIIYNPGHNILEPWNILEKF